MLLLAFLLILMQTIYVHSESVSECKADLHSCSDYERRKSDYCTQEWIKKNCPHMCGLGCQNQIVKKKDIPKWDHVQRTFGQFIPLPLTESAAKAQHWTLLADDCQEPSSPFRGRRYTLNGGRETTLIFDTKGQIAGMQLGYLVTEKFNPNPKREEYVKVQEDGKPYIYLTAYFTDPENICQSKYQRDPSVVADKLIFLARNRKTNVNRYKDVPLYAEEKLGSEWIEGLCNEHMGMHYFIGISADMDCDDWYPFFLMYNKGKLEAWGYFTFGYIPSPRLEHPPLGTERKMIKPADVPKCLANIPDVVSQHVYFTKWTTTSHLCTYYQNKGKDKADYRDYS